MLAVAAIAGIFMAGYTHQSNDPYPGSDYLALAAISMTISLIASIIGGALIGTVKNLTAWRNAAPKLIVGLALAASPSALSHRLSAMLTQEAAVITAAVNAHDADIKALEASGLDSNSDAYRQRQHQAILKAEHAMGIPIAATADMPDGPAIVGRAYDGCYKDHDADACAQYQRLTTPVRAKPAPSIIELVEVVVGLRSL
jgi:hypothetical protein